MTDFNSLSKEFIDALFTLRVCLEQSGDTAALTNFRARYPEIFTPELEKTVDLKQMFAQLFTPVRTRKNKTKTLH